MIIALFGTQEADVQLRQELDLAIAVAISLKEEQRQLEEQLRSSQTLGAVAADSERRLNAMLREREMEVVVLRDNSDVMTQKLQQTEHQLAKLQQQLTGALSHTEGSTAADNTHIKDMADSDAGSLNQPEQQVIAGSNGVLHLDAVSGLQKEFFTSQQSSHVLADAALMPSTGASELSGTSLSQALELLRQMTNMLDDRDTTIVCLHEQLLRQQQESQQQEGQQQQQQQDQQHAQQHVQSSTTHDVGMSHVMSYDNVQNSSSVTVQSTSLQTVATIALAGGSSTGRQLGDIDNGHTWRIPWKGGKSDDSSAVGFVGDVPSSPSPSSSVGLQKPNIHRTTPSVAASSRQQRSSQHEDSWVKHEETGQPHPATANAAADADNSLQPGRGNGIWQLQGANGSTTSSSHISDQLLLHITDHMVAQSVIMQHMQQQLKDAEAQMADLRDEVDVWAADQLANRYGDDLAC